MATWTEQTGSWTIQSNHAQQATAAGAYYLATAEASDANVKVRVRVKPTAASGSHAGGLVFRLSDTSNYWVAYIDTSSTPGTFVIQKVVTGTPSTVTSVSITNQFQKYVDIEVTLDGNDITATADGGFTLTTTDAFNNSATKHGLFEYRDGSYQACHFEDFQVVDLPAYAITRVGDVLTGGAPEDNTVLEPTVIYDQDPQILTGDFVYKMWYTYGWTTTKIGYAESADGQSWTKYGSNPLISGVARSTLLKVDGIYYLYVASNSDTQIDLYTSTDGISFTLDTASVLALGAGGAWDDFKLANTFVWKEGASDWKMLYEGNGGSGWKIGYATSSDGVTWSKSGSNPVLDLSRSTGGPWVKKIGSNYYMWVHVAQDGGSLPTTIKRFKSSDLTTWSHHPRLWMFTRSGATEGENSYKGQNADVFILEQGDTAYIYYSASADGSQQSGNLRIKLITADIRIINGY